MVLTPSAMVQLGTPAPEFDLLDTDGTPVRLADFEGRPLLVAFICNHCPYVKHIAEVFAAVGNELQRQGIGVVAINSNDVENYPDDAPPMMVIEKRQRGYEFPYLFDETQAVARAYDAKCTPDFFLYDDGHRLAYRGQFDPSRPDNGKPVTGDTLLDAVDALLHGGDMPEEVPSMGCNIKWK